MAQNTSAGSVGEALAAAVGALRAAGVENPRLDAELLIAAASGSQRVKLCAEPEAPLSAPAGRRFAAMVRRRLRREPIAYILGSKGFRRIELAVDRRVLIPRPETELLVELALLAAPASVLDVGTGSGALALAIAAECPAVRVTATDTSAAALAVAGANAARLGLTERVDFVLGSVPAAGDHELTVANLPYVAESEWSSLAPEITRWEPREALLGGPDGLDPIRELIAAARSPLLALEVGDGQAARVAALLEDAGYGGVATRLDLAGIERVVVGERRDRRPGGAGGS